MKLEKILIKRRDDTFTKRVECSRGRNDRFEEARQFRNTFKQTAFGALANQIAR